VISCADVEAVAPDLALGLLSGPERAAALAHLDACQNCRGVVEKLSVTVDLVSSMAPPAEPAAGFEARVLERIDVQARRARRPRIALVAAAIVAGALIVGGALWLRPDNSPPHQIASYTMQTPTGRVVGEAYMRDGHTTWVFIDVPGWTDRDDAAPRQYALRVTTDDGRALVVQGDFEGGNGGWGAVINVDADQVRELALIDSSGRVWCSAAVPA
jgi:hypothetical protein